MSAPASTSRLAPMPFAYWILRSLLRAPFFFVYRWIVVENAEFIPEEGEPCIVLANHNNSIVDTFVLIGGPPPKYRRFLRMVARSTMFGQKDYANVLVRAGGAIPIHRRADFGGKEVDNMHVFSNLTEALTNGDAITLFPEGSSLHLPDTRPFKTGTARIISSALTKNRDNPDYQISVLTCSINWSDPRRFRSTVVVTYHAPMIYRVKDHPHLIAPDDFEHMRNLTAEIGAKIRSGTLAASSWELHTAAKFAAEIYAPYSATVTPGDRVRITKAFLDKFDTSGQTSATEKPAPAAERCVAHLQDYRSDLANAGLKDEHVAEILPTHTMIIRLISRLVFGIGLLALALPSLPLWLPVLLVTTLMVRKLVWSRGSVYAGARIGQTRLIYGVLTGLAVWAASVDGVLRFYSGPDQTRIAWATVVAILVPVVMWVGLRAGEDGAAALAEARALARIIWHGHEQMAKLRLTREGVRDEVVHLAREELGLPQDPRDAFTGGRGRIVEEKQAPHASRAQ